jgi:hypothetical protein
MSNGQTPSDKSSLLSCQETYSANRTITARVSNEAVRTLWAGGVTSSALLQVADAALYGHKAVKAQCVRYRKQMHITCTATFAQGL